MEGLGNCLHLIVVGWKLQGKFRLTIVTTFMKWTSNVRADIVSGSAIGCILCGYNSYNSFNGYS